MGHADRVVLRIDGTAGLENRGRRRFKDGLPIVGFYHATEQAGHGLEAWIGKAHPDYKKRRRRWAKRRRKDKVPTLIQETRQQCAGTPQEAAVGQALGYVVRNVSRRRYGTFRAAGLCIGSGVVEAGCQTAIGGRGKQSGMFWSKSGAENILALRCIHSSRRLENFGKHRLHQHAAGNAPLPLAP